MHEISLVTNLIEQVEKIAIIENFKQVKSIKLKVGNISGIDPECLNFCFPVVTVNTILQDAKLEFEMVIGKEFNIIDLEVI